MAWENDHWWILRAGCSFRKQVTGMPETPPPKAQT